ncbi:transient receptor potential cation channel subfamily M member 4-like isoform X2 [Megalobrama amblycephala]|uniref:transient receptor potential cation channel subfamily M member 4-like isoform X2 n=1 Tax=Megalobrama amblycephala TaxID=75352 RepID=UPI00201439A6|nr:transient receptor potential cation channel subfamily M member 4-like isoform X2 [Megalobrama amblycephala]
MNQNDIEHGGVAVMPKTDLSWIPQLFKKRVCTTFVEDSFSNGGLCQCGSTRDTHPSGALGDNFSTAIVSHWDSTQHSCEQPTDAFGELEFAGAGKRHSYFLRLSSTTYPSWVFNIMREHWKLAHPNLVVSVFGGEKRSEVKTWVQEVLRQGLVKAAQSTGAWIISGGLREGLGRCIGEAVRDYATATSSVTLSKVVLIGIAPWGLVKDHQQLVNPEGSFPAKYFVRNAARNSCSLDNSYKAFLLVDDGTIGRKGGEVGFRARLEDYISRQRTDSASFDIPVLNMLISGEASMLEALDISLKNSMPWLVLAGSGGLANLVCDIVENVQSAPMTSTGGAEKEEGTHNMELRERLAEKVMKYFPSEQEMDKLVDKVLSVYQNKDLISIYDAEQEGADDFDTVMLKVLVQASKKQVSGITNPHADELRLAVTWNRVDIAKSELFNGNIDWKYDDLKDFMTDALMNNKPQFVRLFIDHGLNILNYLTYGQLEDLYNSISDNCQAGKLLQQILNERKDEFSNDQNGRISLYEVSQLLENLLGEVCQPFYMSVLNVDTNSTKRKAFKKACQVLQGECSYRKNLCKHPWLCLFIWAVLQNHSEMAIFCWEMCGESVLTALGGCKLLRELSKQGIETEAKISIKEMGMKLENIAHDVFGMCYQNKASDSYKLLIRKSNMWGDATCLKMAIAADARVFFSHDGVQSLLSQIWWGDMERGTELWKLALTLIIPPLCYTNLIKFRNEENAEREKSLTAPPPSATDCHYGETVFSFNDIKQHSEAEQDDSNNIRRPTKGTPAYGKPKQPFLLSRWRQFWYAPVTTFIGNVLMYFLFLILYAYVLLVDFKPPPPDGPAPSEYVLYFWVFTMMCEEIHEAITMESKTFAQRLMVYAQDKWNKFDVLAISLFIAGLCCRMFSWSYSMGRGILCMDYMVFTLRLIHIFAIHRQLGPQIIILGKMIKDAFFFLFFLAVFLIAYGVANQALLYTYDPSPERAFRRVLYRPYLHIFGHIPVEEIDTDNYWDRDCTDNLTLINEGKEPCRDTSHNWLVIILLVIFLLVTNILLVNLLIATFSYTFSKVQECSDTYWKFQRYNLIVEYHSRPNLAPPFIILSHINNFIKRNFCKEPSTKIHHFAIQIKGREANKLVKWENLQKENFLAVESKKQRGTDSERLKRTSAKVDGVLKQVRDVDRRLQALEAEVKTQMEFCTSSLQWIMDTLSQSSTAKGAKAQPTRKVVSASLDREK